MTSITPGEKDQMIKQKTGKKGNILVAHLASVRYGF